MTRGSLLVLFLLLSSWASADPLDYLLSPNGSRLQIFNGSYQVDAGLLQCPCVRLSFTVTTLAGQIQTRHFFINSPGLFAFTQSNDLTYNFLTQRLYQAGAFEILNSGGRIGLGFEGIQWGNSIDANLAEIFRTGIYGVVNLIQNENFRFTLQSGLHHDGAQINIGQNFRLNEWNQVLTLRVHNRHWSAHIRGSLALPAEGFTEPDQWILASDAGGEVRWLTPADLQIGIGLNSGFAHIPFRQRFGLSTNSIIGQAFLEVSWLRGIAGGYHD